MGGFYAIVVVTHGLMVGVVRYGAVCAFAIRRSFAAMKIDRSAF